MRELEVMPPRRLPLLAFLVGLCLLTLTGTAGAGTTAAATSRGDAILSVQSHVGIAARTVTDRLAGSSHGRSHNPAPTASLAAALGALLLAATAVRPRRVSTVRQAGLLTAAGRGPPPTS